MKERIPNEKLIMFFKTLNGKSVSKDKIETELVTQFHTHGEQIARMLSSDKDQNAEGTKKTCVYFGDKKVIACLKSFDKFNKTEQSVLNGRVKTIININNTLINDGASMPKLYAMFFSEGRRFEIHERAKGDIISVLNLEGFGNRIIRDVKNITPQEYKKLFGEKLFEHNFKQQKIMIELPQSKFDELFLTYQILNQNYFCDYDSHSENVLLDKSGFRIVDIDYDQMLFNTFKTTQFRTYENFLNPFRNATTYKQFLTPDQIAKLQENNIVILKKLINTATNHNLDLISNGGFEWVNNLGISFVGKENWEKYQTEILQSQIGYIIKNNPHDIHCLTGANLPKRRRVEFVRRSQVIKNKDGQS